jgi:Cdc6-like AAA superfamily ATPase
MGTVAAPMVANLPLEELAQILHAHLTFTAPLHSQERLVGDAPSSEIEQALNEPGRTIFIYGNHGVGRTSLAKEIMAHQGSDHDPVTLASDAAPTFSIVIRDGNGVFENSAAEEQVEAPCQRRTETPLTGEKFENNATVVLKTGEDRREDILVVIDEFDQVTSDTERARFADFIKQLSDLRLPIRFIFCGVSESLKELLGSHESRYRSTENREPSQVRGDTSFEVVDSSAETLKVTHPHYVHLLPEELFWDMFNDPTFARSIR